MSNLRIYCSLSAAPSKCQWALGESGGVPLTGEGPLATLPRRASRIQLVVSAAGVLLTRVRLPDGAKRRAESVLAFAVEEQTLGEPEANQTTWLGSAGADDVLAVMDKKHLRQWLDALDAAGIDGLDVYCETLLLPHAAGEWSVAWNGRDGFVRTSEFEGGALDSGDRNSPPLSLRLLAGTAVAAGTAPVAITVYTAPSAVAPDLDAWRCELGVPLRLAGNWDWRTADAAGAVNLLQKRRSWRGVRGLAPRLRTAAWLAGAALALHAGALVVDWALLRSEQQGLRRQMEARFRAAVPDALAVVDPGLQMRRKLAEARRLAGVPDSGDFLPMMERVAAAIQESPGAALRTVAYESGRLTLSLGGVDEAAARRLQFRLQGGVQSEVVTAPVRDASGAFVIAVRAP